MRAGWHASAQTGLSLSLCTVVGISYKSLDWELHLCNLKSLNLLLWVPGSSGEGAVERLWCWCQWVQICKYFGIKTCEICRSLWQLCWPLVCIVGKHAGVFTEHVSVKLVTPSAWLILVSLQFFLIPSHLYNVSVLLVSWQGWNWSKSFCVTEKMQLSGAVFPSFYVDILKLSVLLSSWSFLSWLQSSPRSVFVCR